MSRYSFRPSPTLTGAVDHCKEPKMLEKEEKKEQKNKNKKTEDKK